MPASQHRLYRGRLWGWRVAKLVLMLSITELRCVWSTLGESSGAGVLAVRAINKKDSVVIARPYYTSEARIRQITDLFLRLISMGQTRYLA
jgi:hypothetical protein